MFVFRGFFTQCWVMFSLENLTKMTKPQKVTVLAYMSNSVVWVHLFMWVCVCGGVFGNVCVGGSILYPVWVICFLLCARACVCDETLGPSSPHLIFRETDRDVAVIILLWIPAGINLTHSSPIHHLSFNFFPSFVLTTRVTYWPKGSFLSISSIYCTLHRERMSYI